MVNNRGVSESKRRKRHFVVEIIVNNPQNRVEKKWVKSWKNE